MKRFLFVLFILSLPLLAARRVMVCEDFTATWCQYCPGAARGLEELEEVAFDSVIVIAYHPSTSDPFYNQYSIDRKNYYGVTGYPTVCLDGNYRVVGGLHSGTMYPTYRVYFNTRRTQESPVNIKLSLLFDTLAREGNLSIKLRNETGNTISAQLQVAITQSHIYYPWQGMDSLHFLLRWMIPDAQGEPVTLPPFDSITQAEILPFPKGFRLLTVRLSSSSRIIQPGKFCKVQRLP